MTENSALLDTAERLIALDRHMEDEQIELRLITVYGELTQLVGENQAVYLLTKAGIMGEKTHTQKDVDEAEAILADTRKAIGV